MDRAITVHRAPLSLFVMIGVSPRVGISVLANCNVRGKKPRAADTRIIPDAVAKNKIRVCRRRRRKRKNHHLCEFVNILARGNVTAAIATLIPTLSPAVTRVRIPTSRSVSVSVGVIGLLSKA